MKRSLRGKAGDIGGAVVPSTLINLADYRGAPGAGPALLISAFSKAFAALAATGGGTLLVPAGDYDFGSYSDASTVILCRDFCNIAISAYGATFHVKTVANVVPTLFYFVNFTNITIAGASFVDHGFSPRFNWRGMYCVGIQADKLSKGFRMVDCYAEKVVGLLASNNNSDGRFYLADISVHGEVQHAYYGVGANFVRENVHVELVCHNVRRAFIAYALRNSEITIISRNTAAWPGSNGLVALVSTGGRAGNVENVRVRVDVSGECIHSSYVHFYHQGSEKVGYMRDIDATVHVRNRDATRNVFVFDHETDRLLPRTARVWDRIWLHGSLVGKLSGRVISNVSLTTSPGTVYLDHNLAELDKFVTPGAGFHIQPR
ncbi:hypothetical protein [Massilia sp. S19_KUP03_FR1]|uniref:hypothetical protein n=1 Tax=Massilia sp. S19_KUP03_FR1 TaxID=3025503 RepID=UPI002FCDD3AD